MLTMSGARGGTGKLHLVMAAAVACISFSDGTSGVRPPIPSGLEITGGGFLDPERVAQQGLAAETMPVAPASPAAVSMLGELDVSVKDDMSGETVVGGDIAASEKDEYFG